MAPLPPDPRFPDRPRHPDYERLSAAVTHNDNLADNGAALEDIAGEFVDVESLAYMAIQRARIFRQKTGMTALPEPVIASIYLDAFVAGARYQQQTPTD